MYRVLTVAIGCLLFCAYGGHSHLTHGQTTNTTVKVESDLPYAVLQYPLDKEVTLRLKGTAALNGVQGVVSILRQSQSTRINVYLTGPLKNLNVYTVESSGALKLLGPLKVANGAATFSGETKLDTFGLVFSPQENLTRVALDSSVIMTEVPQGLAVIPVTAGYTTPLLGIPSFKAGDDKRLQLEFFRGVASRRANVFINPRKDGPTAIKIRLEECLKSNPGKSYVVWAVSVENEWVRLGEIKCADGGSSSMFTGETTLPDFGVTITLENAGANQPNGEVVAVARPTP